MLNFHKSHYKTFNFHDVTMLILLVPYRWNRGGLLGWTPHVRLSFCLSVRILCGQRSCTDA